MHSSRAATWFVQNTATGMGHRTHGNHSCRTSDHRLAGVPLGGADVQQNEARKDPQIESSLLPHQQPACAPLLHRPCTSCGLLEEDWTRCVEFGSTTQNGNEIFATGRALFDTGAKPHNLLSLDFVESRNIPFEPWVDANGKHLRWWKRIWYGVFGKCSRATCYTVDQRPITDIGVVENLRWRGIAEPRCNSGLDFPQKFLGGRFLVVKNLPYDAIFSSKTMNDAGLRGSCFGTVAVTQPPKPTQDPNAARKSRDAKEEQKRIQQKQEQGKRDEKGRTRHSGR